jgi:hypothetical protein
LSNLLRILGWTYKNDFVEPLPELILLLGVVSVASHNFLGQGTSDLFSRLTWDLDIIILVFVAIAGVRSYSQALERGEVAQQFLSLRISRAKFVLLKWLSLFIIFVIFALTLDAVAFVLYLGFFPSVGSYSAWGDAPVLTFLVMLTEQIVFLAFLNSLVMAVSFGLRKTTVSLLVFFAFTLFSAGYLVLGSTFLPDYLQIGYGDYIAVNGLSTYAYDLLYRSAQVAQSSTPAMADYLALVYRALGAVILYFAGLGLLIRADLD